MTVSPLPFLAAMGVLAAMPGVAHAADSNGNSEIVVTGRGLSDTPATPAYDVQDISREALTMSASGRIEDVLSNVAGFQQFRRSDSRSSNPSAQGVTLRALGGNAASRALVLLDGVPMADPMFGAIPLSAIAPDRLGSVRVTRGGGSGAFGAGAVSGTIELTSADADAMGLLNGQVLVNDRGETDLSGTLSPKLGQGFVQMSGQWQRGQGFWTTPESQRVPASVRAKYDSWSASARVVQPLGSDFEMQARGLAFNDWRTLRFAGADTNSRGEDASLRLVGRGSWQLDALVYGQWRNFSNVVISSTNFKETLDQRNTPSTGWGGKLELRPPVGGANVLRLGTDWRVASGHLEEDPYSTVTGLATAHRTAGGRNSDVGLFAEDDWKLGGLVLTAGARADRWSIAQGFLQSVSAAGVTTVDTRYPDRSGWQASWRGGAVFDAGHGFSLRAAAYTGLRMPTINELYRTFVVGNVTTNANAALVNEKLVGFEGGLDYKPSANIELSITGFDNKLKHAIANVTTGVNVNQRQNVDAIHATGIELAAALRFGQFSLDGSLAWTDSRVEAPGTSLDGRRPAQTPKIAASGTLSWKPREHWLAALTLRHVGAQFEDDLGTSVLPAATTLNAYVELPLAGPFSLVLRGENLTDTDVQTRNQVTQPNQPNSIDLGPPRTVWVGVKVRVGQ